MHYGEHQGSGTEGLTAHVVKDRHTEATEYETGVEQTPQGLSKVLGHIIPPDMGCPGAVMGLCHSLPKKSYF